MKREIKFRLWDSQFKKMKIPNGDISPGVFWDSGELLGIQDYLIPLQFTGLLDKNGVEIYESDIVRGTGGTNHQGIWEYDKTGVMQWQGCGFDLVYREAGRDIGCGLGYADGFDSGFKVIGNIYKNPELLENK